MKINITLAIIFLSFLTYAQDVRIPEVTPPSPNAFELTKYGSIPVNEFSGMINATIPLYTYRSGNLELPISLNYRGAGVKVNQLSSWTGVNWTLQAGGVISRTVDDAPDEFANDRMDVSEVQQLLSNILENELLDLAYGFISILENNNSSVDTKPDYFSFSFNGYSGSFYLDENFNPTLVKKDSELKIETVGTNTNLRERLLQNNAFCITTPDGVRYYFGGNVTEKSYTTYTGHDNLSTNYITSYYLYQIVHPIDGTINLEYVTKYGSHSINIDKEQHYSLPSSFKSMINTDLAAGPTVELHYNNVPPLTISTPVLVRNRIIDPKFLRRIYSLDNNEEVFFDTGFGSPGNYLNTLTAVRIKKDTIDKQKIELKYLYPLTITNSSRFFLEKVEFDREINASITNNGNRNEVYTMEYNDFTALPERFSFSQDKAGFYNGMTNTSFIPETQSFVFRNALGLADRSPVFNNAEKGSLSKIFYPTGGFTKFEYESPKAKGYNEVTKNLSIWRNKSNRVPQSKSTDTYQGVGSQYLDTNGNVAGVFGSLINQKINVHIQINANDQLGHDDKIRFKLIDITQLPYVEQIKIITMPDAISSGQLDYSELVNYTFDLVQGHDYKMELSFYSSNGSYIPDNPSAIPVEVSAVFRFIKDYTIIDDFGIRIKKVIEYSSADKIENSKRYYYTKAVDVNKNPLEYLQLRKSYNNVKAELYFFCSSINNSLNATNPGYGVLEDYPVETNATGNIISRVFENEYQFVTTSYGGDNFESGGIEKEFYKTGSDTYFIVNSLSPHEVEPQLNHQKGNFDEFQNGTLFKEITILKKDNNIYKQKQVSYTYIIPESNHITGFYGKNYFFPCSPINAQMLVDFFLIEGYSVFSKRVELSSVETIDYIQPVPIADGINEADYKKITSTTNYMYGDLIGLPTSVRNYSSNGDFLTTRNYYVNDLTIAPDLLPEEITAYNYLKSVNRVSQPFQVNFTRGPELISKQRTTYKTWNGVPSFVLPSKQMFAKGTQPFEDRIIYSAYDPNGNLSEVSLKDGSKTKYFYNGMNQLWMQIKNYIAPEAGGPTGTTLYDEITVTNTLETNPCYLYQSYPNSIASVYTYDPASYKIKSTTDSNCIRTFYEYDALYRLKYIKRQDNLNEPKVILKEFDYRYQSQN